ncbi:hypothetical protein ACNQR7_05555 [Mycolicibacterium senegalense]|uniref:hypothetical protein n=1 Tax=Mycolicibacterium TaxID=1866885 RepID=UPI003204A4F2
MPYPALASSGAAPAVSRRDKFLLAGVAMMSASAIAVTPVAQNTTVIEQAKSLAYDLTASMDAAASPVDVYGSLFETTFDNLQLLGGAVAANPAPLLSQILQNQLGYAEKFGAAFEAIPASLETWYNGTNGKARLDQALAALEAGDIGEAYRWFNHSMLYAFNGAFGPIIAPGLIISGIPRGGTEYLAGIPEQIAQNFTNLVAATFTRAVVVSALFQGAFGTVSGSVFELSRIAESISTSVAAGDFEGAINAVVNTPAILANAVLNGFDYADVDPETGTGGFAEWPALLTFAEPGETGAVAGLLQNLLVNIPKSLAEAIAPKVETPEADAARTIAVAQELSADPSVSPLAKLTKSAVVPVKVETATEPATVETAVEPVKEETPAVETPKEEVQSVDADSPAADDTAAGSVGAPAVGKTVGADTNTGADTTNGKVKIGDRLKAKFNEAKEARQAKAAAAKEAKAAAKEAKAESKAQSKKTKEAKSKESKKDSGSAS